MMGHSQWGFDFDELYSCETVCALAIYRCVKRRSWGMAKDEARTMFSCPSTFPVCAVEVDSDESQC
jgi:hypothetical protein